MCSDPTKGPRSNAGANLVQIVLADRPGMTETVQHSEGDPGTVGLAQEAGQCALPEQRVVLQIVVPQLHILQICQVLHAVSGHF